MTTRPSDPDYWYAPDTTGAAVLRQIREAGEYRRSDPSTDPVPVAEAATSGVEGQGSAVARTGGATPPTGAPPASVPEGMETTAEERAEWHGGPPERTFPAIAMDTWNARPMARLCRDLDRALAEIARLTAINADLLKVNLSHAEALACLTEEWEAAVLAEREACAQIVETVDGVAITKADVATAIRARPTP